MRNETTVCEIMIADHAELVQLLAELINELCSDSPDVALAYRRLDFFWARLAVHIRAEHLVLFPAVIEASKDLRKPSEDISTILQELRDDHDLFMKELASAIKLMRLSLDHEETSEWLNAVLSSVEAVRDRLKEHDMAEETSVYPLIERAAPDSERLNTLVDAVKKELENVPSRFHS